MRASALSPTSNDHVAKLDDLSVKRTGGDKPADDARAQAVLKESKKPLELKAASLPQPKSPVTDDSWQTPRGGVDGDVDSGSSNFNSSGSGFSFGGSLEPAGPQPRHRVALPGVGIASVDYSVREGAAHVTAEAGVFTGSSAHSGVSVSGEYRGLPGRFDATVEAGFYHQDRTGRRTGGGLVAAYDEESTGGVHEANLDLGVQIRSGSIGGKAGVNVGGRYESTEHGGEAAIELGVHADGLGARDEVGVVIGGKAEASADSATIGAFAGVYGEHRGRRSEGVIGAEVGYETDDYGVTLKGGVDLFGFEADGAVRIGVEEGTIGADIVDGIRNTTGEVVDAVQDFIEDAGEAIAEGAEEAGEAIGEVAEEVVETAGDVVEEVGEFIEDTGEAIAEGAEDIWNWLTGNDE